LSAPRTLGTPRTPDRALRIRSLCTRLEAAAHIPPPHDHLALVIEDSVCGTAGPEVAHTLANAGLGFRTEADHLVLADRGLSFDALTARLNDAALCLKDHGLIRGWRDEALAVVADVKKPPVARIERAACRALGLTTFAVHLNAWSDPDLWLARRSAKKAIDPGQWDSLVGGMVTANESERVALDREAFEEAGLVLSRFAVQAFRRVHVWRPVPEGYQSEVVRAFEVELPRDVQPVNHDGEADRIERREPDALLDAIDRGELTLEAALVTLESLARRCALDLGTGLFFD
jgi:8-oxo-dGTP pyrophosphatase MutT (NUDIX family)